MVIAEITTYAVTLLHPGFLVIALLVAGVWVGPLRTRDIVQGLLRTLVVILVAFGLARPVILRGAAAPTRVWIVDGTPSIAPDASRQSWDRIAGLVDGEQPGRDVLITLGDTSPPETRPRKRGRGTLVFDRVVSLGAGLDGVSPLPAALSRANAEIPARSAGSVTVFSDGLATRPDDGRAIQSLRARGIPVHVAPQPTQQDDVRPVGLRWEGELREGQSTPLTITLAGSAVTATVVIADDDGDLAEATLGSFTDRVEVALPLEPREAGYHALAVRVQSPGDSDPGNNTRTWTLPVQDPRRIAYVGAGQEGGAARLAELLGRGFDVIETPLDDAAALERITGGVDLVVLDDVPADRIPGPVQHALVKAVADDGLGLIMSGGRSSFGAGGWHDTAVEAVLPVELVQKEEKRDPSTTLVIVIDTSGSMSGTRVQLAKEVSRLAIRRLMPHDKVGIVEFYGAKRWAAPIQPASNRIEIERALNRLDAGGGTIILPAIEEAFYGMQNIDTRYKHVLVLTDGGVEAGAFEPLLRRMADEGINVSTVLVGGGIHSEFLVNLSNWGRGRFYSVPNRFNLPEVIYKQPSSAKLPAWRQGTHAVRARGGQGWWGPVDPHAVPALAGYVETRARPGAEVLLETTEAAHPVVSTWRWGLGRVTAIATEPVGAGTGPWREWAAYGQTLARLFERTAADGRIFDFTVDADGADLVVTAHRLVPETEGLAPVLRRLDDDDDDAATLLPMERMSPDRWVTRIVSPPAGGTLLLEGGDTRSDTHPAPGADPAPGARRRLTGPSVIVDEMYVDPAAAIDLVALAAATGGRVLGDDAVGPLPVMLAPGLRAVSLTPLLLLATLAVFVGELVWRRRG